MYTHRKQCMIVELWNACSRCARLFLQSSGENVIPSKQILQDF